MSRFIRIISTIIIPRLLGTEVPNTFIIYQCREVMLIEVQGHLFVT